MTALRFTPYAWAKLIYMRDKGPTEVAGYGISSIEEPLLVTDFMLVPQESSSASFEFDNEGLADYVDDMIDLEMQPAEFQRILIHTHPGNSANPSNTDEENFKDKFSDCDWAIMYILANGGDTTCALKYKHPECRVILQDTVDFHEEFGETRHEEWDEEYKKCVKKKVLKAIKSRMGRRTNYGDITTSLIQGRQLPKKVKNPAMFPMQGHSSDDGFDDWEDPEDLVDIFNRGGDYNKGGMY